MSLTLNSRPATWAGTSNPILYKLTTTDQAQAGYFLQVELWDSTLAAKVADAKYYPTSAGALSVDVSGFLSSQMSLDNNSDLTSGTVIFTDNNWIKYYIKYRQVWTGSIPAYTDDVANLRFAIYGGLQVGVINDFTNYTSGIYKFLTNQSLLTAIKNYPFTFSFYEASTGNLRVERYFKGSVIDSTLTAISATAIARAKVKETSTADRMDVSLVASPVYTWTTRTAASSRNWFAVCFGNGLFVSVAQSGVGSRAMRSSDGIIWSSSSSSSDTLWSAIVYGAGLYVAVANVASTACVMTSPDGITFTGRTGKTGPWQGVAYGNGVYVAVGNSGAIMYSYDAINWNSATGPNSNNWQCITFANGVFVAGGIDSTGTDFMTSSNGINWTARTNTATDITAITYGNGLFIAVSSNLTTGVLVSSDNGVTWNVRTSPNNSGNGWNGIAFGNGLFVAISTQATITESAMTSPDGTNWTLRAVSVDEDWRGIAYGNNIFVAVSSTPATTSKVMTSPGFVSLSETKTINILEECSNIVNLQWKNSLGGDECFPFKYSQEYTHDLGNGRKARRATLYAENLTLNQWEAIQGLNTPGDIYRNTITELLTTTNRTASKVGQAVYILNSDGSKIGVVVINQNNKTQTHQRVHRALVTIEYPEIFLQ